MDTATGIHINVTVRKQVHKCIAYVFITFYVFSFLDKFILMTLPFQINRKIRILLEMFYRTTEFNFLPVYISETLEIKTSLCYSSKNLKKPFT
jgi:hypothetical protein